MVYVDECLAVWCVCCRHPYAYFCVHSVPNLKCRAKFIDAILFIGGVVMLVVGIVLHFQVILVTSTGNSRIFSHM